MYIKLNNGVVEKYPYSISELRKDNPQVSFPSDVPESLLAEYGVYSVEPTEKPANDISKLVMETSPELINGVWKQVWEITNLPSEKYLENLLNARANEYPPIGDQLDALFHAGLFPAEMADKIQAIKDKYPKGE
jgi:hypothetical protein